MIALDAEKQDRLKMVYPQQIWPGDADRHAMPSEEALQALAESAKGKLLCLDIEHFKTYTFSLHEIDPAYDILGGIVDRLHEIDPALRIGYYILPGRFYWDYVFGRSTKVGKLVGRMKFGIENGRFITEGLADKVDVTFPSGYTMYGLSRDVKIEQHRTYLDKQVKAFRRLQKQMYLFVWPRYHPSAGDELGKEPIPLELWQQYLQMAVDAKPDGLVYWDFSRGFGDKLPEHREAFHEILNKETP